MRRRVLIVEDEQAMAGLLKRHLEDAGCTVQRAFRGDQGLRTAQAGTFDLLLLDVMLPGIDGIEICRRLRSKRLYIPIIMITARASDVDKVLGLDMGADDYITKPFSVTELMARVRAMFRRIDALEGLATDTQPILQFGDVMSIDCRWPRPGILTTLRPAAGREI